MQQKGTSPQATHLQVGQSPVQSVSPGQPITNRNVAQTLPVAQTVKTAADREEKKEEEKKEDEDNSVDKYERQVGQEGQPDLLIGRISQLYVDSLEPKDVQGTYKEVVEITRMKYIHNHC